AGLQAIEVTFTVPGADRVIAELRGEFPEILVGAGTVLDSETARAALLAGAQFLVTPILSEGVAQIANRYRVPGILGALTPTEIAKALDLGASVIKLFPGEAVGPAYIKAIHGPFPQAPLMPTGGVTLGNLAEWLRAGAVAVGVGSALLGDVDKTGDFAALERRAAQWLEAAKAARS
ncbi:MAG: bifunctional 4-hydroxy-2-oxoglutarate aldolase/2-dehydro-3-deoxy-phosphogluconate aldolase, partial [Firmicutes bacterium]|nr:bifunctional 4-hydroxy-2-oxoglutarate aldolase/2-dehydro-3-deoxy-phosphogluconate aldolase [Bacillota bacterium]